MHLPPLPLSDAQAMLLFRSGRLPPLTLADGRTVQVRAWKERYEAERTTTTKGGLTRNVLVYRERARLEVTVTERDGSVCKCLDNPT